MTQDEIIEMAQEARQGVSIYYNTDEQLEGFFERFARLIAEKEREACAKEADATFYSVQAAENIRARGQA